MTKTQQEMALSMAPVTELSLFIHFQLLLFVYPKNLWAVLQKFELKVVGSLFPLRAWESLRNRKVIRNEPHGLRFDKRKAVGLC